MKALLGAVLLALALGVAFVARTERTRRVREIAASEARLVDTLRRSLDPIIAFDQAQRLVPLSFSPASGGLSVTLPASRTAAPPGPYLLFLVSTGGVPSVGRIMRLE